MPLYEFKCLTCHECFEFLVMNQNEPLELRCPACRSEAFERLMSASCYSMGGGPAKTQEYRSRTRSCPSGTCTTYDIPGPK